MQRIPVDFSRVLEENRVEVGFADTWQLQNTILHEGEHIIVYETGLEVEGILHAEQRLGKLYWYVIPDWATRKDTD
jgi:hypothetical protein